MPVYTQTLFFEQLIDANYIWNNRYVLQKSVCAHVCLSTMETEHISAELNIFFEMSMTSFNAQGCIKKLVCEALYKTLKWIIETSKRRSYRYKYLV